ncbi:MAG: LysM peptidoglycan-binding domain-containing protein [Luteolibacter sp.]
MSLWTVFKLLAGLGVLVVMAFTGMLAYHVTVKPLGGVFEQLIPNPAEVVGRQPDAEFAKMLDSAELPDIDPGEKAFQKAHELLALGKTDEARIKLIDIVNRFPSSTSSPIARRIVGEMNLDEVLSSTHMEGKKIHTVKRGNSFLGIAAEHQTTLDMILHLNGMMELKSIQPGDELIVMPLAFRLLIEPQRKALSVWDGARFIREYPILHLGESAKLKAGKTKIGSKSAELDGHSVAPQSKDYRAAQKVIQLAEPTLQIRGAPESSSDFPNGLVLLPQDMEEVSLLTRVGNDVEIR